MTTIKINRQNSIQLPYAIEILYRTGVKDIELEFCGQGNEAVSFSQITETVYKILDYESKFGIWLRNIPFCVMNENSIDHILPPTKDFIGEKTDLCRSCRYFDTCSGLTE